MSILAKTFLKQTDEMRHFTSLFSGKLSRSGLFLGLFCILFSGISPGAIAQPDSATISGKVTDANSGQVLVDVKVFVKDTNDSVLTGRDGLYFLREIEPGNYTLVFASEGFAPKEYQVSVLPGDDIQQDVVLSERKANQDENLNFTVAITYSQIEQYGDYSVEETLSRLPGVQVNREGTLNLRGVGYNSYYVTMNGQRMGTTGLGDRAADLGAIAVDNIKEVEFIKVLTPDMHADGLAGVINLKTYQPMDSETQVSGGIGGGVNPVYQNRTGPAGRAWVRYAGPVSENMSIEMGLNYQRAQKAREALSMGYGTADFGSGNVDVLNRFSPGFEIDGRNRFGANFSLNYYHSSTSSFYFHGMINIDNRENVFHQDSWLSNEDWTDQNTTGTQGSYNYSMRFDERNIAQYTFKAGGKHLFENLTLRYDAGWVQSSIYKTENLFPFGASGVEYTVNRENINRPEIDPIDSKPVPADMRLLEMNYIIDNHIDKKLTGIIDVEFPLNSGSLKFGASALHTEKDANERGAFSEYHYTFQGFPNLSGFEQSDAGALSIFGNLYNLDRVIDTEEALSFFEASIPNMRLDSDAYYADSEIYNYLALENIYAGFGMATFEFGELQIIGGARVEHTASNYEGRKVEFNRFGLFEVAADTTTNFSYTNLFPHAQVSYQVNEKSNIKLAYSRSVSRPDFNFSAPFELTTPEDTSIYKGNSGLQPITSDNIDLFVNYSLTDGGMISIGWYFKNLSNLIMLQHQTIQIREGDFPRFDNYFEEGVTEIPATERSFENSEEKALVYGLEVAFQQSLNFLPGFLSNFSTSANYTWSQSEFDFGRGEKTTLPGQSPHVVNAALGFSQSRFSAQISYHRSAESLSELQDESQLAPAVNNGQVYLDRFQDGRQDLSANVSYKLSNQVKVWANVYNILLNEQVEYAHNRDFYPTSIYKKEGIEFNVGVRFNL